MKYRILTDEELKELETEFKHFLISNDISSEEWEKTNNEDPYKAIHFVELFSDIVLEKALKNTKYLEHRSVSDLKVFKFEDDKAFLIALKAKPDAVQVDFSDPEKIQKSIVNYINQIEISCRIVNSNF